MSKVCKFENCKTIPRNGDWCSKHSYRSLMSRCEFIKLDGTQCDNLSSKNFCKIHCYDRTPNQCTYIGSINGRCTNKCKKVFCPTHNPKSIMIRNETTKEYNKNKYHAKKELLNEIMKEIDSDESPLSKTLCEKIKKLA